MLKSAEDENYFLPNVKALKPVMKTRPIILMGGVRKPITAEKILKEKTADFIAMCRPLIYEPDLPNRWKSGDSSPALCISCNACLGVTRASNTYCVTKKKLEESGVKLLTGTKVMEFLGDETVQSVRLDNGEELKVDSVILGIGATPNTKMAFDAGLDSGRGQGIWVDEYMRTSDPDILAVGDCAEKKDFYTRRNASVMLASTATAEARIAGANIYQLKVVRENKGTIAIYSTYINGLVLGSAGLTESSAKKEGFEIVIGQAEGQDKHPGSLPGAQKVKIKLIFSRQSGIIMGGQICGGISAGEIINIIGMAIQQRVAITELETLQMATHPYLTAAPTKYPVVLAAQDALNKM